jgi:hypothetical protein
MVTPPQASSGNAQRQAASATARSSPSIHREPEAAAHTARIRPQWNGWLVQGLEIPELPLQQAAQLRRLLMDV